MRMKKVRKLCCLMVPVIVCLTLCACTLAPQRQPANIDVNGQYCFNARIAEVGETVLLSVLDDGFGNLHQPDQLFYIPFDRISVPRDALDGLDPSLVQPGLELRVVAAGFEKTENGYSFGSRKVAFYLLSEVQKP